MIIVRLVDSGLKYGRKWLYDGDRALMLIARRRRRRRR
jgi:hypothetical protein